MATTQKRGNSFRIMASAGRKMDGRQIRPAITWTPDPGMTDKQIIKELERQKMDFERTVESGQFISSKIRFAEYAEIWMCRGKDGAEKPLAPKTFDRYTGLLVRINAAIGHIKLDNLQPHHIREFLDNLKEAGIKDKVSFKPSPTLREKIKTKGLVARSFAIAVQLSPNTVNLACNGESISKVSAEKISKGLGLKVRDIFTPDGENDKLAGRTVLHHYRLISAILTASVVDDNILRENPAKRVRAPHCERLEVIYLDEDQALRLLELAEQESMEFKTAVKLLLFTGMRRGEALGLKWEDINLDDCLINICRASQYTPSKGVFEKDTKNESSTRTIKIPAMASAALREYKKWQNEERLKLGDLWEDGDWLFTAWNGTPMNPDTLSGWFGKFIRKTDLPKIHVHTLRHTNATLLIASGENVRTVSNRLGHAQTSTTMNIYSHAIKSADDRAAETLENISSPLPSKSK